MRVLLLLALLGVPLAACKEDEEPGRTVSVGGRNGGRDGGRPSGGGGTGAVLGGTGGRPAGSGGSGGSEDDGGLDGGELDGAVMGSIWCDDVEPAPLDTGEPDPNGETRNGLTSPTDLIVTRAQTLWEAGCAMPVLRITLSDGGCPVGEGHELTFFVPADGVENSSVVIGQNLIMEEPAVGFIRARYTRPSRFSDDGVWGSCDGASGTVDIIGTIDLEEGSTLEASFMLELSRCDGQAPETVRVVRGTFNIEVPESLDEVCPVR